jgi:hypothetical protein
MLLLRLDFHRHPSSNPSAGRKGSGRLHRKLRVSRHQLSADEPRPELMGKILTSEKHAEHFKQRGCASLLLAVHQREYILVLRNGQEPQH